MKLNVPAHILAIPAYVPGKPVEELERERGVRGAVKLASNENPLGPSPQAVKAARQALSGVHRYPESGGYELTRALAARLDLAPGNIVLGNGSDEIIGMLATAFLQPGDEVIMARPSFAMYEIAARAAGAVPVAVPLADYCHDLAAMAGRVTPRTRMVFVNSPHNPTGSMVRRAALEALLAALPADVLLVLDEAYIEFVRAAEHPDSRDYVNGDRPVVGLRTFSKAYGLAGMRIGYGIMPAAVAEVLHRVRQPFNVSLPAQKAAAAALGDLRFLERTLKTVHAGVDFLYDALREAGLDCLPSQSNFLFFEVPRPAQAVFEALLDRGVIVRPLAGYGYPQHLRVSVGRRAENLRFIEALRQVLGA
ncbi:MAG: histidinol-phosphate transaminase [Desulfobacterales bacterium]|jgi:histidinol-phosphate aminotransferase|nr:histidinol-phosphate transaminase [Desulfobacterales bacterium]